MDEKMVKRLMTNLKCELCGYRYGAANIQILGHRRELWFLSVVCPHCHRNVLLAVVVKEGKIAKPVTDLSPQEIVRFAEVPPVEADDVLDMHLFLKEFDGDFSRLFAAK